MAVVTTTRIATTSSTPSNSGKARFGELLTQSSYWCPADGEKTAGVNMAGFDFGMNTQVITIRLFSRAEERSNTL